MMLIAELRLQRPTVTVAHDDHRVITRTTHEPHMELT